MYKKYFPFMILFVSCSAWAQPITIPKQYVYPGIPFDNNKRISSDP
ncbi:unnamed protein product, partial [marine sediment metagenome]